MSGMICDFCDGPIVPSPTSCGCGHYDGGKVACYTCCAWLDAIAMSEGRSVGLYFNDGAVSNWPGTLVLPIVKSKTGNHNMAGKKTTHHFRGPNGSTWTGTLYHGPCSGDLLRNVRPLVSR